MDTGTQWVVSHCVSTPSSGPWWVRGSRDDTLAAESPKPFADKVTLAPTETMLREYRVARTPRVD